MSPKNHIQAVAQCEGDRDKKSNSVVMVLAVS